MADGYDYGDPPRVQSAVDKLKGAGFTTGQAIAINHVVTEADRKLMLRVDKMMAMLRDEIHADIKQDRDNTNTGRYIVTVALVAAVLIGFALGKVFG